MIEQFFTRESAEAVANLVIGGLVVWQRIEAGRIKRTAEVAKERAEGVEKTAEQAKSQAHHAEAKADQTERDVNSIDLAKADRARSVEKFIELERRLKQVEDGVVALLSDRETVHRATPGQ